MERQEECTRGWMAGLLDFPGHPVLPLSLTVAVATKLQALPKCVSSTAYSPPEHASQAGPAPDLLSVRWSLMCSFPLKKRPESKAREKRRMLRSHRYGIHAITAKVRKTSCYPGHCFVYALS